MHAQKAKSALGLDALRCLMIASSSTHLKCPSCGQWVVKVSTL
ncbi:Hypothetical protein CAP_7907 [Chondromyces apiculatus DSM 436]|uniref:Uncharacterized protein n=1 Tax=Chondromyces apiculatus DSM 436 TaxID=1192034 RepID=A0A017SY59_9BACT|nr:Hypothetical protein CAP_7907 [Chondromyces apiculatus DSM 436]